MTDSFSLDPTYARDLRHALDEVGYEGHRISGLLGASRPDLVRSSARLAYFLARKDSLLGSPLGILIRLLLFTHPVSTDEMNSFPETRLAREALTTLGVLQEQGPTASSCIAITPLNDLLLASDPLLRTMHPGQPVMAPHASTLATLSSTSCMDGGSVLDLGCGGGAISLCLAEQFAVRGTDTNPRAVEYARFNARMNGLDVDFMTNDELVGAGVMVDHIVFNSPAGPQLQCQSASFETAMSLDQALRAATDVGKEVLAADGKIDVFAIAEVAKGQHLRTETGARMQGTGFRVSDWREVDCPELHVAADHVAQGRLSGRTAIVASSVEGSALLAYMRENDIQELLPICVTMCRD